MLPALPGLSPALPGAPRLVVDRQALCKRLQHNYSPCEECNTRVVLMMRIRHHKVKEVRMQRVACNSPSERTRFRQSRQSRLEHPGVSDGNSGRCWCSTTNCSQPALCIWKIPKMQSSGPYTPSLSNWKLVLTHCPLKPFACFSNDTKRGSYTWQVWWFAQNSTQLSQTWLVESLFGNPARMTTVC